MRQIRLDILERDLDKLFVEAAGITNDELKSHLAKYLCLQISGYLETTVKNLVSEYHDATCKKETASFVTQKVERISSLNDKNLLAFLDLFSVRWVDQFSSSISEQQIESLNSIIAQRHLIAHGKSSQSNITIRSIQPYYQDVKQIISVLKTIIKK